MSKRTGRFLTVNELGEQRQREAQWRVNEEERLLQQLEQATTRSQDPFDSQLSTITVAQATTSLPPLCAGQNAPNQDDSGSPRESEPSTPPHAKSPLPIRTPTTVERPRRRQISLSESSESEFPVRTEYELPASTAPPKLGVGKRKRAHTKRYQEARAMGDIAESQEAHKAERG